MSSTATIASAAHETVAGSEPRVLHALVADFGDVESTKRAAERIRDAGYTRWDVHTPYPVHGMDKAMGMRPTRLPWIVFVCGVAGFSIGTGLQWWTNATNPRDWLGLVPTFLQGYDFTISGKPDWSLPANIPVMFELTILLSAFGAVFGMLMMNGLPAHHQPVFRSRRFLRATNDRFVICIEAADPRFREEQVRQLLTDCGAAGVERVEDWGTDRIPTPFFIVGLIFACLALVPPALVARSWVSKSTEPRIHIIQDMDNQERFKSQQATALFADGRAERAPIAGTIARGDLAEDEHYHRGTVGGAWVSGMPAGITIDQRLLDRGQNRFNIHCAHCHGLTGFAGDEGMIPLRAKQRGQEWLVVSLHDEERMSRPIGQIFNSITNGVRTMPPYGHIPAEDRWAIVAYVKALQRSQAARLEDASAEQRADLQRSGR